MDNRIIIVVIHIISYSGLLFALFSVLWTLSGVFSYLSVYIRISKQYIISTFYFPISGSVSFLGTWMSK